MVSLQISVAVPQNALPCLSRTVEKNAMLTSASYVALPHPEVPTAEFYKHISAQLTEPTRMRCLLGWCGSRALPSKPDAPKESSKEANAEFQALQAGKRKRATATNQKHLADNLKRESYKKSYHKIWSQNAC
jgi:hypothetical protein